MSRASIKLDRSGPLWHFRICTFDKAQYVYEDQLDREWHQAYIKYLIQKGKIVPKPQQSSVPTDYEQQSISRAVRSMKDLIFFGVCPTTKFLTLTFSDSVRDRAPVRYAMNNMCKRYEIMFGHPLPYLSVLELHPGGHGYHVHMLVNAPYISQKVWHHRLWQKGFVSIRRIIATDVVGRRLRIARYLVKYLRKAVDQVPPNSRRYNVSKAWPKPPNMERLNEKEGDVLRAWLGELLLLPGASQVTSNFEIPTGERGTVTYGSIPNTPAAS